MVCFRLAVIHLENFVEHEREAIYDYKFKSNFDFDPLVRVQYALLFSR